MTNLISHVTGFMSSRTFQSWHVRPQGTPESPEAGFAVHCTVYEMLSRDNVDGNMENVIEVESPGNH